MVTDSDWNSMCTAVYDFQNRDYLYGTNKLITLSHVCAKGNSLFCVAYRVLIAYS